MVNLQVKVYVLVMLINVQAWGTLGKNCMIYLQKGKGAKEVGRLRQERWSDKEGASRERIIVVAEHVEFKKEPNTTTKAEEREELDELDQEIAF
nr:single-stranded DNA-binding protein [uncultured Sphaerochaeta sp.]